MHIVGKMYTESDRVGRALSFVSSRRNWDSPNPSPEGECAPLPGSGGRVTLAGERGGWESPNSGEGTYTVVISTLLKPDEAEHYATLAWSR
jgi:hypothetical protein